MTDVALQANRVAAPRSFRGRLKRLAWYFDDSETSRSKGAQTIRRAIAGLLLVYAGVLEATAISHGDLKTLPPLFFFFGALALLVNRFGRFTYYFVPVLLGLFAYVVSGSFVNRFSLPVHYTPQLRAEEYLTPGAIPTLWLQEHLYHGRTGVLEVFSFVMYTSHFSVPLLLGVGLALTDRGRAFALLMFGILAASLLGEMTFILAPTAPPWLAGQEGYIPRVHHILKQTMYDLHLTKLAALDGDASKYNVTAAVPSLHIAFPVICVLTAIRAQLPRIVVAGLVLNLLGVTFAIVYTGEHYLVDALAGALYGLVAFLLVRRLLEHGSRRESASSEARLALSASKTGP
jgi:hypothetical protein